MNVYFAPEAEADFAAIVGYLVERNPQTLASGDVVRSWPVPPVRIYYQRRADAFWVLRIYHQAQTPIVR